MNGTCQVLKKRRLEFVREAFRARGVAMFVVVADDDHAKSMITAHPRGRRLSGLGAPFPSDPAVAAVLRITAAAIAVTAPSRVGQ